MLCGELSNKEMRELKCPALILPSIQKKVNQPTKEADKYDAFAFPSSRDEVCSCMDCPFKERRHINQALENASSAIRFAKEKPYQFVQMLFNLT